MKTEKVPVYSFIVLLFVLCSPTSAQESTLKSQPGNSNTGILSGSQKYYQSSGIPEFWYEDNNTGVAAGYPPDFPDMFYNPEKWAEMRSEISGYLIRGNTLKKVITDLGTDFITGYFAPLLVQENIPLAIDNPSGFDDIYTLLKQNEVDISLVALQSVLSKIRNDVSPQFDPELGNRIQEVKDEIAGYKEFAPEIRYGIIDARPTKGWEYKNAYLNTVNALESEGQKLDFILLDCPYSYLQSGANISWDELKEVENYIKNDLQIEFGLIITDNFGGKTSDALYYENVMAFAGGCSEYGINPDFFVMMSWFSFPEKSLPENAPEGQYPMTKTGLDLFKYLRVEYEKETNLIYENSITKNISFRVFDENLIIDSHENIQEISIYDLTGQKVYSRKGSGLKYISLTNLQSGLFIISFKTLSITKSYKIFKK